MKGLAVPDGMTRFAANDAELIFCVVVKDVATEFSAIAPLMTYLFTVVANYHASPNTILHDQHVDSGHSTPMWASILCGEVERCGGREGWMGDGRCRLVRHGFLDGVRMGKIKGETEYTLLQWLGCKLEGSVQFGENPGW